MRKLFIILLIFSGLISCHPIQDQPGVSTIEKDSSANRLFNAVMWQEYSAEYRAICYQTYQAAGRVLIEKTTTASKEKPLAVIVDVDETILNNSAYELELIRQGKTYESATWRAWVDQATAGQVPGSLEFCRLADSLGVHIIYVSNRKLDEQEQTLRNLQAHGYPWARTDHLFFKDVTSSKEERRARVGSEYEVLMFIGDNLGDFSELFQDRSENYGFDAVDQFKRSFGRDYFVLPNPMYGTWEEFLGPKG
jgi:5'-nucleotidase (lipoprotein e(P4) family)